MIKPWDHCKTIAFVVGALLAALASAPTARAQSCTSYPNTLSNGSTADANQVMANFNCAALLGGAHFTGEVGFTGAVGIGTPTPQFPLQVFGAQVVPTYSASNPLNPTGTLFAVSSNGGNGLTVGVYDASADYATWMQSGFQGDIVAPYSLILQPFGGKVGIANAAPTEVLDVYAPVVFGNALERISLSAGSLGFNRQVETGTIYNSSHYGYQFQHTGGTTGISDYLALQIYTPTGASVTGSALAINGAGDVSVDTVQSGYTFFVSGTSGGTQGWTNTSDARLKTKITDISNPLDIVDRLHGVRFRWRSPTDREIGKDLALSAEEPQIGFIAQEVAKVVPEAVTVPKSGKDGPYGVKDSSIVPILVEAIKAQQAEIKALQAEVAVLKSAR